jgi:phosphatidate cytidylyltransferase
MGLFCIIAQKYSMNEMLKRAIFGALYVLVLVVCTYWHPLSLVSLFFVLTLIGSHELVLILNKSGVKVQKYKAIILSVLTYFICVFGNSYFQLGAWYGVLILFALFISTLELFNDHDHKLINYASTLLPAIMIGFAFACIVNIAFDFHPSIFNYRNSIMDKSINTVSLERIFSPKLLIFIYILIWVNDTFAYLSGKAFGKHKLLERISPKKTWEGFLGGMMVTMLVGSLVIYFQTDSLIFAAAMLLIGAVISIAATIGDLIESMAKRSAGIKDSGNVIPGHGGVLDRLDSLLYVGPIVYAILMLANTIIAL